MARKTDTPTGAAEAPGLQSNPAAVAHPLTGELLEHLERQPPEVLADALAAVQERQAALKEAGRQLADELRRRLDIRQRKSDIYGSWLVELETTNESVWDPDELEFVLRELVDQGALTAGECTGVIRREPQVSRSEANRVLGRLQGAARQTMDRCRTWKPKGAGRIRVTQSAAASSHQPQLEERPAP